MTRREKTDGERIALKAWARKHGPHDSAYEVELALDIDRIIRRRVAEAWEQGWLDSYYEKRRLGENPYGDKL